MKTKNYFLLTLLLCTAFTISSCSKEDGGGEDKTEEQHVPQSKAEAEQKIKGKWELSGSGEIKSLEFMDNGIYIMEVDAASTLFVAGKAPRSLNSFDFKREKFASVSVPQSGSSTKKRTGAYTVGNDGKTVSLDTVATVTIKNLTGEDFSFSITFAEDNKTVELSLATASSDTSSRTMRLAGTWAMASWPDFYSSEELAELDSKGFTPQHVQWTITNSGTIMMIDIAMESSVSPDPGVPAIYHASLDTTLATWYWKNAQSNAIIANNEDGSMEIGVLDTSATLKSFAGFLFIKK